MSASPFGHTTKNCYSKWGSSAMIMPMYTNIGPAEDALWTVTSSLHDLVEPRTRGVSLPNIRQIHVEDKAMADLDSPHQTSNIPNELQLHLSTPPHPKNKGLCLCHTYPFPTSRRTRVSHACCGARRSSDRDASRVGGTPCGRLCWSVAWGPNRTPHGTVTRWTHPTAGRRLQATSKTEMAESGGRSIWPRGAMPRCADIV